MLCTTGKCFDKPLYLIAIFQRLISRTVCFQVIRLCCIHRNENMIRFQHRPAKMSLKGIADIIIAKHRNGAVGEIQLRFISELTRFLLHPSE